MDKYAEPMSVQRLAKAGMSVKTRFCAIVVGVMLSAIVLFSIVTIFLTHGKSVYTLDDPYISLALGWHIAQGHYGINGAEVSSPSSSILFPFVLAGFAWSSWQQYVPLIVNSIASIATAALFALSACRYSVVARPADVLPGAILLVILCIAMNMVGLVFIGLEHSLHALTSVAVVFGLAQSLEDDETPVWLAPAIVLLPLWRFEGMALAGSAIVILTIYRQWRTVILTLLGLIVTIGAYAALMTALGLPVIPSSVLVKSSLTSNIGGGRPGLGEFLSNALHQMLEYKQSVSLLIAIAVILLHPVCRLLKLTGFRGNYRLTLVKETLFALGIVAALAAHILFGAWGWFSRYEIYAVQFGAAAALVLWHRAIANLVQNGGAKTIGVVGAILISINILYIKTTLQTPFASRGIFEQQYQIHRFVTEFYKEPVAVNDLGWASYQNPDYVLDLWGLGSEAARRARLVSHEAGWMDQLTQSHQVKLAIIYTGWFKNDIPPNWKRIAIMQPVHHRITSGGVVISFYSTSEADEPYAIAALKKFAAVSEPAAKVTLWDSSSPVDPDVNPPNL